MPKCDLCRQRTTKLLCESCTEAIQRLKQISLDGPVSLRETVFKPIPPLRPEAPEEETKAFAAAVAGTKPLTMNTKQAKDILDKYRLMAKTLDHSPRGTPEERAEESRRIYRALRESRERANALIKW